MIRNYIISVVLLVGTSSCIPMCGSLERQVFQLPLCEHAIKQFLHYKTIADLVVVNMVAQKLSPGEMAHIRKYMFQAVHDNLEALLPANLSAQTIENFRDKEEDYSVLIEFYTIVKPTLRQRKVERKRLMIACRLYHILGTCDERMTGILTIMKGIYPHNSISKPLPLPFKDQIRGGGKYYARKNTQIDADSMADSVAYSTIILALVCYGSLLYVGSDFQFFA